MIERSVQWIIPPDFTEAEQLLLFSACDAGYLGYAISLIRSADLYSPGFTFVLHIINPVPDSLSRINKLVAILKHTRLFVSCEQVDLSVLELEQKRAYYASARFPRLSTLLADCRVPILSIDADSLIVNPIDLNFSDKLDAEVVIVRRDLVESRPEHLSIATGSIWFLPTQGVIDFLGSVADEIDKRFHARTLKWFVDQIVFFRKMKEFNKVVKFYNLKRKYADWEFGEKSIIWAGKGGRKLYDMRFFIIQALLSDDNERRELAHKIVASLLVRNSDLLASDWILDRFGAVPEAAPDTVTRIALYLPRLDLPWKSGATLTSTPPAIAEDVIELRLYWKAFTLRLANAIERAGVPVDVIEVPAWEINRQGIEAGCSALALVPHRCHLDFEEGETPVYFYMQEFFRWVFIADERGWSAASSAYPVDLLAIPASRENSFDVYRQRLLDSNLGSKFAQAKSKSRQQLIAEELIPSRRNVFGLKQMRPYIFLPLQIPHDQSIRYFSDLSELEVVEAVIHWARERNIAVVMKPHPANLKSMLPFEGMVDGSSVFYSQAHVYDLIKHAASVYTINSGVGFEALLQIKPVVTFGRVEYDCVTFKATLANLDQAWEYSLNADKAELEERYRRFVNWFLGDYAVDMSQPDLASARLNILAESIVVKARNFISKGTELSKN